MWRDSMGRRFKAVHSRHTAILKPIAVFRLLRSVALGHEQVIYRVASGLAGLLSSNIITDEIAGSVGECRWGAPPLSGLSPRTIQESPSLGLIRGEGFPASP